MQTRPQAVSPTSAEHLLLDSSCGRLAGIRLAPVYRMLRHRFVRTDGIVGWVPRRSVAR